MSSAGKDHDSSVEVTFSSSSSVHDDEDNCIRRPIGKIGQRKETKLSQTSARSSAWIPTDEQLLNIVSRAVEKIQQVSSLKKQHEPSVTNNSNGKESYVCHMPNWRRNFTRAANLQNHFVWHQGKINFACSHCNEGFERKDTFLNHVQSHTSAKQENKKIKKVTRKRRAALAMAKHINNVTQLACSIEGCTRVCHSCKLLDAHIRYQHGAKTHCCTCPHCDKRYRYKSSLNKHIILRHEDEEPNANVK